MHIFKSRGVFIDVYKADDKIATSGAKLLADIDLRRIYRAIYSVAAGRIEYLFYSVAPPINLTIELIRKHKMQSYLLWTRYCRK